VVQLRGEEDEDEPQKRKRIPNRKRKLETIN